MDLLAKLERDMTSGFLQPLVLAHVQRHGPIHGYGLIKAMDASTGEKRFWKDGTVYPLLGQLENQGLIKSRWGKGSTGPRRKYYEMTPAGRRMLEQIKLRWHDLRDTLEGLL